MGTDDLAPNGPGGSLGNGALGTSSFNREPSLNREGDARPSLSRDDFETASEHGRVSPGFSQSELVPVSTSEDPANYISSFLEPVVTKIPKRPEVVDDVPAVRIRKATTIRDHAEPSLRIVLSDPLTGDLMEDATILPCGHSFGSGGVHRVLETSACITCGTQVSQEALAPNYALQAAVQAYKREEENWKHASRKRRRERLAHDQFGITADQASNDILRLRGVQFPVSVGDRVMIKGNKRTPDRFVSREAVITSQCLNGWFMVKTSDNGETVKLQYRSLMKVGSQQSLQISQVGDMSPN